MADPKKKKRQGLNATEAAAILGATRKALNDWDRKRWLVRYPDRSIDVDATRTRVQANADPARSPVAASVDARPPAPARANPDPADVRQSAERLDPIPEDCDLNEARRRKEYWSSELKRMETEEKRGDLVPVEDVRKAWQEVCHTFRSRMQDVAARQVDALLGAGVTQAGVQRAKLETILSALVDEALTALADEAPGVE